MVHRPLSRKVLTSIGEEIELSEAEETNEASKRGKLTISIHRGEAITRRYRENDDKEYRWDSPLPMETSKKVAIDFGKSHSLK